MLEFRQFRLAPFNRIALDNQSREIEVSLDAENAWLELLKQAPPVMIGTTECTPGYYNNEGKGWEQSLMANDKIVITVELNVGDCAESIWTSDLSHEYVAINAEYRT